MNKEIPDFNDRCRLALLDGLENPTAKESNMLSKLKVKYINNQVHKNSIELYLFNQGYMDQKGLAESLFTPEGYPIDNPENNPFYATNTLGHSAFYNGTFISEAKDKFWNNKFSRWLAIFGAILTLIAFIWEIVKYFNTSGK